jgi:prepilin-type N-terminal cleavage/methylation domain-containing protein
MQIADYGKNTTNSELRTLNSPQGSLLLTREGKTNKSPRPSGERVGVRGVTLIEVILVLVIVGILAAIAIPKTDVTLTSGTSVDGAANMIASDIRYAQECAMANRVSKSVTFTLTQNFYIFPVTVPSTSSLDPSGRLPEGVTISNNSTNPYTVTFNSLGEPITGGNGWVEVTIGGQTRRITVLNYTGKVNIS